jgi:hypothetical protein
MTTPATLTLAQRCALHQARGRTHHLARAGYCIDLDGPYIRRATAEALVRKKLVKLENTKTELRLTPKGRRVAQELAGRA